MDKDGNKTGGRQLGTPNKDKPFKAALLMEAALAEAGEPSPAPKGSLRHIARQLLERGGEDTMSAREIADRFDGKVPQAHIGDSDEDAINIISTIRREIVRPDNKDS